MNDLPETKPVDESPPDNRYLAIVGGLLIVIVGVLATLWLRERSRAAVLENEVSRLRRQTEQMKLAGQVFMSQYAGKVDPLGRNEWYLEKRKIDGQLREVFVLKASAGQRLGLAPGDVAVVASPAEATTRPAGSDANDPNRM
ncbi:MAG: hypothetical protein ACLFV7_06865 [Phycisphaerae bacterium]